MSADAATPAGGRHAGRVVVVTGGGSGIGLATAARFAAEGAIVFIVGRRQPSLAQARDDLREASGLTVRPVVGDVADEESMAAVARAVVEAEGGVDVLINNAGMAAPSVSWEHDGFVANVEERLRIDVVGTVIATRAFVPHLRVGGSIVNMGSVYAGSGAAGAGSYSAAKGAIVGLTRSLAVELGPRGIRVNCVSPGWVDVPKWDDYFDESTLHHLRSAFARVPLRTAVTADEIAAVYSFLAHEDAAAVSGQDIVVDRGMSADLYVAATVPGLG